MAERKYPEEQKTRSSVTAATTVDETDGDGERANVWEGFLKNASQTGRQIQEGHLIVVGNANCGKTRLTHLMGRLENMSGEMKQFLMMRYSYIHITDSESDEQTALLNIWQISEPSHLTLLDVVVKPSQMSRIAYLLCIDCGEPESIQEQYEIWMGAIHETQERLLARIPEREANELRLKISTDIQFYVNPNDAEAEPLPDEEKEEIPIQAEVPEVNLGCPIIIVGTKADMFRKKFRSDADANDRYDLLMGFVRMWALRYGASVFNMAIGLKEQGYRILQYIDDRLFGAHFNRAPNVSVALSNITSNRKDEAFLFVPAGFDTQGIISAQAGGRSLDGTFTEYFQPSQAREEKNRNRRRGLRADPDQTFYRTLKFDLDNAQNQPITSSKPHRSRDPNNPLPTMSALSAAKGNKGPIRDEAVQTFFRQLLNNSNSKDDSARQALTSMSNNS